MDSSSRRDQEHQRHPETHHVSAALDHIPEHLPARHDLDGQVWGDQEIFGHLAMLVCW